ATVMVLFRVTPSIAGFGFTDVFLMITIANVSFGLADLLVGNVERLSAYVRMGLLDAVRVRPLGVLLQLVAMDVAPRRIGRIVFSSGMLVVAASQADLTL